MHYNRSENRTDNPANSQVPKNEHEGHPNPPLKQHITLLHDSEPVDRLEHRNHGGQVLECNGAEMVD